MHWTSGILPLRGIWQIGTIKTTASKEFQNFDHETKVRLAMYCTPPYRIIKSFRKKSFDLAVGWTKLVERQPPVVTTPHIGVSIHQ